MRRRRPVNAFERPEHTYELNAAMETLERLVLELPNPEMILYHFHLRVVSAFTERSRAERDAFAAWRTTHKKTP